MASLTNLATSNLALKGAGTTYNFINRFFATKAEADAALADSSWAPVAGRLNACLTGDQGLLVYNAGTTSLDLADTATRAYVDTKLSALTGDAPALLDTLGEIADALNDDPNFFATTAAGRAANAAAIAAETTRAAAAETTIQADIDQNEADADAAIAALQADVDQNEADADAAIAAVQADVNQNEADADAAIAALQADVDGNEADADAAIAGILDGCDFTGDIDVDGNTTATQFHARGSGHLVMKAATGNDLKVHLAGEETLQVTRHTGTGNTVMVAGGGSKDFTFNSPINATAGFEIGGTAVTATAAELNYVDGVTSNVQTQLDTKAPLASPALTGTPTAPTASQSAGTTQIATTAYVDTAVANLIDSSPGALNTLNELAAAIGDDANFSTTITNSIAAVQADVNQNEVDSDAADAALSGRLDTLEADPTTATALATVQADVDQNEADADAALALKAPLAGPVFTGVPAGPTAAEGTNTGQLATTAFVTTAALAAEARNEAHIDNVATLLGIAKDGVNFGAFSGSTVADNQTLKTILQALETKVEAVQSDVDQNESDADTAIATKLGLTGGQLTGNLTLRKSDGSAVALVLSRADHADMSCVWKIQPSYVSATKEVLTVLANGQVVAHFDERQRFAINMNDPDYTLDVGGDGHFSTNLVVDGNITCDSGNLHAQTLTLGNVNVTATGTELNYVDGVTSNIQTQLDAKLAAETITLTAFKAVVAASSDFADFKSRVSAL